MPTLTITRGLPGSGKTTWAKEWAAAAPGRARVNRDDIRERMFGATGKTRFDHATEQAVTAAQQAAVRALLRAGRDVIVDDTNLRLKLARAWADLAVEVGADFVVQDFTDVPLERCIGRDAKRYPDCVGEDVIRDMHAKFLAGGRKLPPVTPTQAATPAMRPYERPPFGTLPTAWLVDIDGTLALMDGRGPYDWHRVGEDRPNLAVVSLVRAIWAAGHRVVFLSGRDAVCRDITEKWLGEHVIGAWDGLHMRPQGDMRKDSLVKDELFEQHVRDRYDVIGVIDDREQVVRMWRAKGLTVAQVAEGKF